VEIWSNEFRRWIYVDGNTAWYAVDYSGTVPLSLWELRQRQLAALAGEDYRPIKIILLAETKYEWIDLKQKPAFVELRLIPRSNFLQQRDPLPLNQGMRGWFWPGHYVWSDDKEPARLLYSNFVTKRGDFEWTLNQAQLSLEATDTPGVVRVHVDTETPGFAAFVASTNKKPLVQAKNTFHWQLKQGENTFEVTPRNVAGRTGVTSSMTVRVGKSLLE
jgi:hypothetical protein